VEALGPQTVIGSILQQTGQSVAHVWKQPRAGCSACSSLRGGLLLHVSGGSGHPLVLLVGWCRRGGARGGLGTGVIERQPDPERCHERDETGDNGEDEENEPDDA